MMKLKTKCETIVEILHETTNVITHIIASDTRKSRLIRLVIVSASAIKHIVRLYGSGHFHLDRIIFFSFSGAILKIRAGEHFWIIFKQRKEMLLSTYRLSSIQRVKLISFNHIFLALMTSFPHNSNLEMRNFFNQLFSNKSHDFHVSTYRFRVIEHS
jgi:hypothetical protein